MKLKTLTWNIGGGKVLAENTDKTLMASYNVDGMDQICFLIRQEQPDIITIQEAQSDEVSNQVAIIARNIGYDYDYFDEVSESHIDKGMILGNGIISRFPITDHTKGVLENPGIEVVWEDGAKVSTHEKGYTRCIVEMQGTRVNIATLHLLPFKRFNIELGSNTGKSILRQIDSELLTDDDIWIIQGDFNVHATELRPYFPRTFELGAKEIVNNSPTIPKGSIYDHVIYKGLELSKFKVLNNVMTDHYPILAEFEISAQIR